MNSKTLIRKAIKTLEEYSMISKGDSILVAVSGGADSIALLHFLINLKEKYSLSLFIGHVNHMLRGKESIEDEKFVKEYGYKLGIPVFVRRDKEGNNIKKNIEERAREIRYTLLEEIARECNVKKIATAHTMDDQAETFLLRLIRGGGRTGLCGIPYVRNINSFKLIRPFLNIRREEIIEFLKDREISYRTDSTNKDLRYLRNRVRHILIPVLEKEFNTEIISVISRTAKIIQEEEKLIKEIVKRKSRVVIRSSPSKIILDLVKFMKYNKSIKKRLIMESLSLLFGKKRGIEQKHIESVLDIASGRTGREINLPKGINVRKSYKTVIVELKRQKSEVRSQRSGDKKYTLEIPGRTKTEFGIFECGYCNGEEALRKIKNGKTTVAYFDTSKIKMPLLVRTRENGDCFMPLGLSQHKKLKEVFIDDKIPRDKRNFIPLLLSGEEILWIVGNRTSEIGKIEEKTKKALWVRFLGRDKN